MSTRLCRIIDIPGPPGGDGQDGAAGADGQNAYSYLVGGFVMPNVGDTVLVEVASSGWVVPGQVIAVEFAGSLQAVSAPDATHVELLNLGYDGNAPAGQAIPDGSRIGPGGMRGPAGLGSGSGLDPANNLSDVADPAASLSNLGAGDLATKNTVADADFTGTLSLAKGGTGSSTQATARTALGLGTIAVQAAAGVAITGGAIDGTAIGATTPAACKFTTLEATGTTTLGGKLTRKASAVQTIGAGSTILVNAPKVKVVGNAGPVTVGTLPTLSNGTVDGDEVLIQGTDAANTVTLQDNGTLAGSRLRLGANNRVLGKGDTLLLSWDQADARWYEVSYNQPI